VRYWRGILSDRQRRSEDVDVETTPSYRVSLLSAATANTRTTTPAVDGHDRLHYLPRGEVTATDGVALNSRVMRYIRTFHEYPNQIHTFAV